jgi:hypothetical protein
MSNLIFPYTKLENPVCDKLGDSLTELSLISLEKSHVNIDGLYSDILKLPDEITEKINVFEKFYLQKNFYDKNFNFYNFISDDKNSELPENIVKELKNNNLYENKNETEKRLVLSGLFLRLFEKYESDKKNIDTSFAKIQKKEQELFNNLTNTKSENYPENQSETENFSPKLIEKRLFSWLDIYFYLSPQSKVLLTDKEYYLDVFQESGCNLEDKFTDSNGFKTYVFSLGSEFLMKNNKNIFKHSSLLKPEATELQIKLV